VYTPGGRYVYGTDESLSVPLLFEVMAFVNILRFPATLLSQTLTTYKDAEVALARLTTFFTLDHRTAPTGGGGGLRMIKAAAGQPGAASISIAHGAFKWQRGVQQVADADRSTPAAAAATAKGADGADGVEYEGAFGLEALSLEVSSSELVAVVGKVGSGKSSLFQAILGEMPLRSGGVSVLGRTAYAAQVPWIQNKTIRGNVLFGSELAPQAYHATLDASALRPDLALLPSDDLTEIGERGINLSGGQKARVSLARVLNARSYAVGARQPPTAAAASQPRLPLPQRTRHCCTWFLVCGTYFPPPLAERSTSTHAHLTAAPFWWGVPRSFALFAGYHAV